MNKGSTSRGPLRLLPVVIGVALLVYLIIRTGTGTLTDHLKAVG